MFQIIQIFLSFKLWNKQANANAPATHGQVYILHTARNSKNRSKANFLGFCIG